MKKIFSYFVAAVLCALCIGELSIVQPDRAQAGVLTRGSASNGLGIRVPRAHDRSVRKSTADDRSTAPNLEYRGVSIVQAYSLMQRRDRKYEKQLLKWERKKQRIEMRAAKKREKEEKAREKKLRKLQAQQRPASAPQKSAVGSASSSSGEASITSDPRAWFRKKIIRSNEGGSLSLHRSAPKSAPEVLKGDQRGTDLNVQQPAQKKSGFWNAIWRALGGS